MMVVGTHDAERLLERALHPVCNVAHPPPRYPRRLKGATAQAELDTGQNDFSSTLWAYESMLSAIVNVFHIR